MDLFCSGGNFGRGLKEGGAVQNCWAVDWANCTMHTYQVNLKDPDATELYNGSVNAGSTYGVSAWKGQYRPPPSRPPARGYATASPRPLISSPPRTPPQNSEAEQMLDGKREIAA